MVLQLGRSAITRPPLAPAPPRPNPHDRGWHIIAGMWIGATSVNEYQLERFLFGAERVPLERVRGPIIELQEGRCFYCAERLASRAGQTPDVDHFIPWSRSRGHQRRDAGDEPRAGGLPGAPAGPLNSSYLARTGAVRYA